jgi:DNA-binding response OmpR family regulator
VRVLLVDDDEIAGRSIRWALEEEGFEVAVVHIGRQAPGMIMRFKPDVVVLDINLSDMNGMELARLVRIDWPKLPMIFASGSCERIDEDLQKSIEFLMKPYPIAELVEAIHRAVPAGG